MKASLKFRENENPIIKAKIPLNILKIPFSSTIETSSTNSKDKNLSLNFTTFFQSGPVLKFSYRLNDSNRPFGLVIKTGTGSFGSPIEAPIAITAEFNFISNGNPSFFLHFKSQLGDFSIRRLVNSGKIEKGDESQNVVEGLFGGEVSARTVIPIIRDSVVGKIQWGLKFPAPVTERGFPMGEMPYMVVNKLGIEHVGKNYINRTLRGNNGGDVAVEGCLDMKKELGNLELEKKEMEELNSEISAVKFAPADGGRKVGRLRRMVERLSSRKAAKNVKIRSCHVF